jgi:predicted MFS family arabinose efflux permease
MRPDDRRLSPTHPLAIALALSIGAAISIGIARFSYALLLPPMRDDLGWSYFLAGAMNTGNAIGYLAGALATPTLMRRFGSHIALAGGALLTALFMLLSGFATDAALLLGQRVLAGMASAITFTSGGVLVARLGALHGRQVGLLLGLYYGGAGFGIVISAQLVPRALAVAQEQGGAHGWQWAWIALGLVCLLAIVGMIAGARKIPPVAAQQAAQGRFPMKWFAYSLAGYGLFGVGYIGYMTFIVALLKQQGMAGSLIDLFYTVLGLGVVASSFIWARMLDRFKGGQSFAILNLLLGTATLLPVLTTYAPVIFLSGLLFGSVFLSVVASTTALVRHNLPQPAWSAGISVFTTVFAFGQIIGPAIVGWIADGAGGLERGFVLSALTLFTGALLALRQQECNPNALSTKG